MMLLELCPVRQQPLLDHDFRVVAGVIAIMADSSPSVSALLPDTLQQRSFRKNPQVPRCLCSTDSTIPVIVFHQSHCVLLFLGVS